MNDRDYRAKRKFDETPEPEPSVSGNVDPTKARPGKTFMIHQHHATRLHFDLRLEMMNGRTPVLVSWAVPKNLPLNRGERHLAVHVEDHPFDYGGFSGTIPKGNYGAGEVRIFDSGTYEILEQEPAKLTIKLDGSRVKGVWHMIQTKGRKGSGADKDNWLVLLRENLRGDLDPLPVVEPMTPAETSEAFDDDDWLFEPEWSGVRSLVTCANETLLMSSGAKDMTPLYPELEKTHQQLVAFEAVLDGAIVSLEGGVPSAERLEGRMKLTDDDEIHRAAKARPVTFVAFDLLYLDGRSLLGVPLTERKELLDALVVKTERVQVSTYIEGAGSAFVAVAEQQGLPAVLAKKADSSYQPGGSDDWVKIPVGTAEDP